MTAEGDNSVLMQKVAKERLSMLQKKGFPKLREAKEDLGQAREIEKAESDSKKIVYFLSVRCRSTTASA